MECKGAVKGMKVVKIILFVLLAAFLLAAVLLYSACSNMYKPQYKYKEYDKSMYTMDRSKIQIGVFDLRHHLMTEEHLKVLKECGIDYIIHTGNSDEFYKLCEQYEVGIFAKELNTRRYIASTPIDSVDGIEAFDNFGARYKDYPSLYGDDIYDEPGAYFFDLFADIVEVYRKEKPDKIPFFNLHPMYCPDYNYYLGTTTYEEYIKLYVEKVDTDYICFDIYPFDNSENGLYHNFLYNMDLVANACRESGRDFWVITQAGVNSMAYELRKEQVGWQLYSSLAYGAVSLIHACYTPCWWAEESSIVDNSGNKNPLYDIVQEYNRQIHNLSDVFMKYKNLGVVPIGKPTNFKLAPQFDKQNEINKERNFSIKKLKKFNDIKSDKAVLVGCFEEKDGKGYAAMFVNSVDPYKERNTCTVTFKASSKSKVTAYIKGEPVVLKPVKGVYTVQIDSGDGVFVTIN